MDQNMGTIPRTPHHNFQFFFETSFDVIKSNEWFNRNMWIPFFSGVVYLVTVFSLQSLMKNRKPLTLNGILIAWNLALAVFSGLATARVFPEFLHILMNFGIGQSFCDNCYVSVCRVTSFWSACFILSKIPELFDTLFMVLKKRPVSFLHVFHHASVLVFSWTVLADQSAIGRWYQFMNLAVHSAMYSYYALTTMKIKVPRQLAMSLTLIQITQMIVGFLISLAVYGMVVSEVTCQNSLRTVLMGILFYLLYGVLFVNFFIRSYFYPKSKVL